MIGFFIYIASNVGLALNNTYTGLMVLRGLQSCGSSGMATLKTAIIADVVTSAERGSYIALTSLGAILGPSISPIAGGLIAQHLGWHWIFWFLVIISAIFFIPLLAFFPETGRHIVGDGSIPPAPWNKSLLNIYHEWKRRKAGSPPPTISHFDIVYSRRRRYPNPWSTVKIMCEHETALILLFGALIYAGFYAISTTLTTQFTSIYHLSPTFTGLLFLPQAVGSIFAAFTNGKLLDSNYQRHARRLGLPVQKQKQPSLIGFPIEKARIEIALPMFCTASLAIIVYGWLLEYKVKIAGPIVLLFVTGYTCLSGFSTFNVLIIDIHRDQPATASAASNLTRCLLGAGASALVNPMIEAMGNGWCFTMIGLVWAASMPILWVIMKYGPEWRRQRDDREKEQHRKEQVKEENGQTDVDGQTLSMGEDQIERTIED
jgi:MFS family permease